MKCPACQAEMIKAKAGHMCPACGYAKGLKPLGLKDIVEVRPASVFDELERDAAPATATSRPKTKAKPATKPRTTTPKRAAKPKKV